MNGRRGNRAGLRRQQRRVDPAHQPALDAIDLAVGALDAWGLALRLATPGNRATMDALDVATRGLRIAFDAVELAIAHINNAGEPTTGLYAERLASVQGKLAFSIARAKTMGGGDRAA